MVSLLAAAATGSLACSGLFKTDQEDRRPTAKFRTADVHTVASTALIAFIAMRVARHPQWVALNNAA